MAQARHISRIVPNTAALKALAHPVRVRMLGILRLEGPSTSTQLAARLKLNTGATSYHLRQLALHGFIDDAHDLGNGRERWWQARHETTVVPADWDNGEGLEASMAFSQAALTWQVAQMQRALETYTSTPKAWRQASAASDFTMALTPEQAKALSDRLHAILWEAMASAPKLGTELPEGVRPFTIALHAFLLQDLES